MTTARVHSGNNKTRIVVIVLIILIGWFGSTWLASTVSSSHGFDKHLEVALKIMDCFRSNGRPYMGLIFKGKKDGRYYLPCQLPDGTIGLGIFDQDGNNITSYIPGDGTWNTVREYILQRATRITSGLPFSF